jgi:hypothetical protein
MIAASLVAGAGFLGACGDDDDTPPPPPPPPPADAGTDLGTDGGGDVDGGGGGDTAQIRIVHASPNTPGVDVYAGDATTPAVDNLTYQNVTDYLTLPAGTYTFKIRADGTAPTSDPALTVSDFVLEAGDKYTIVAAGSLTSTDAADRLRVLPLKEGFGALASGQGRVRMVHACYNAPTVGVDVGNDGTVEIAAIERFADTGAEGVSLPVGPAQVGVVTTGASPTTISSFSAGVAPTEIFVIATGDATAHPSSDKAFGILAVTPDGFLSFIKQNPRVYALHGSPDAPAVDIFAGTAELVGGIEYGQLRGPLQVPPGDYTLDFFAAAAGTTRPSGAPAASDTVTGLTAGGVFLAMANGFLAPVTGEPAFEVLALADGFVRDDSANVRLRVVHGSPSAPAVTVGAVTGDAITTTLAGNVAYGASTDAAGISLPPTTYTVGFAAGATTTPVLARFTAPLTTANTRFFAIAHGHFGTPVAGREGFGVWAIDASNPGAWAAIELPPVPAP